MRRVLLLTVVLFTRADGLADTRPFDLVVYGGTAGGVITAVASAREGLKVALVEPGLHLGGLVSGGLGRTDHGKKEVIGGLSLEFFERLGKHYGEPITWYFEPSVGEKILREMVAEARVDVFYKARLREKIGVRKRGSSITEIRVENGDVFRGKIFADATYEGDLMAQAGVSFTWGREGMTEYGESLAGVREHTPKHQFTVRVSPHDAEGRLLPEVQPGPKGAPGAADRKVQAYNFRFCMTQDPKNMAPFPKPDAYTPARYELLARMLSAMTEKSGRPPRVGELMNPLPLKNGKYDTNNNGAFSTDYLGGSWEYPNADYKTRDRIWQAHKDYMAGFFYFLNHDPRLPVELRTEMNGWGLCKDEFTATGNWPHQLYVREARRMVGEYVMSQKDIQTELTKPDAIGMGSYNSDSHNVTRLATVDGAVENEGDMQVPVTPYQIPYRVMLPKRTQATNLLVPVAFSATHVAYSTLRMEPQYMIIGHAAGVAAKMAVNAGKPVQDIDTAALRARLRAQRAVFQAPAVRARPGGGGSLRALMMPRPTPTP
jgi:hypothetical protein